MAGATERGGGGEACGSQRGALCAGRDAPPTPAPTTMKERRVGGSDMVVEGVRGAGALDTYSPALSDPSEAALVSHVTPILSAVRLPPH